MKKMRWIGRAGFAIFPRWLPWQWWSPWHRWNATMGLRIGPVYLAWADRHGWWDELGDREG